MNELILGIDDAGRGPIIGPMLLAGVLIKREDEPILKEWGAKDSKQLTPEKRDEIVKKIKEKFRFHFESTSAEEIDLRIKSGTNLNKIEALKSAKIINELLRDINEKVKVIIDCPSVNIPVWKGYVEKDLEKKDLIELSCEHKADANHICVSAASIIAKTTRDAEIEVIKKQIGINFGSGYPSDPVTIKFLQDNLEKIEEWKIARTTWETFEVAKSKKAQKTLF